MGDAHSECACEGHARLMIRLRPSLDPSPVYSSCLPFHCLADDPSSSSPTHTRGEEMMRLCDTRSPRREPKGEGLVDGPVGRGLCSALCEVDGGKEDNAVRVDVGGRWGNGAATRLQ